MNKYTFFLLALAVWLVPAFASAHTEGGDFSEAENIIEEQIPCDELTDDQLEHLGDYYMEQVHPGEAHEYMDKMMGGEGSKNLSSMHRLMAEQFYCEGDLKGTLNEDDFRMFTGGVMGGVMGTQVPANMMGQIAPVQLQTTPASFWQRRITIGTVLGWLFLIVGIAVVGKFVLKK